MKYFEIVIESLEIKCIIGILNSERATPQNILVDISLKYRYKKEFINYINIKEIILENLRKKKYGILEDALEDISEKLKSKYKNICRIKMAIKKLEICEDCRIGVNIDKKF